MFPFSGPEQVICSCQSDKLWRSRQIVRAGWGSLIAEKVIGCVQNIVHNQFVGGNLSPVWDQHGITTKALPVPPPEVYTLFTATSALVSKVSRSIKNHWVWLLKSHPGSGRLIYLPEQIKKRTSRIPAYDASSVHFHASFFRLIQNTLKHFGSRRHSVQRAMTMSSSFRRAWI